MVWGERWRRLRVKRRGVWHGSAWWFSLGNEDWDDFGFHLGRDEGGASEGDTSQDLFENNGGVGWAERGGRFLRGGIGGKWLRALGIEIFLEWAAKL